MRLLFLACLTPRTGNCFTAERIQDHIESAGHTCVLRDVAEFKSASDVTLLMTQEGPFEGALAIHLFKGGRLLLDAGAPFGVVFGGTDVNEDVKDEHKRKVMEEVLRRSRFAVAFSKELKEKAEAVLECGTCEIFVQAQGIETRVSSDLSWSGFLHRSGVRVNTVEDLRVFLLVCGLRKVKDPLYLLKAFSEWHAENPRVILIIIGPKVDFAFSAEVEECVRRSDGVFLAAERSQEELHTVMQKSFALVNSSVSEGMSAAILEAMDLGVPVLARDIPGNAAIVKHEMSGLLYSSPEEFVSLSKRLLSDAELQETLKKNGKRYVSECHSSAKERTTYRQLVDMLH
ncbi:glycosyltransferase 1 domain-containing protein 1 [Pygocentrus nattereri]|uniref:Glycosyl transferase family 1 domain-containing protein n=1 Tax=Pygocentrus nattereri TaxID=42514 RepID=A0AAR2JW92_PYGNA|nr:glycosyltransferase 1 domain-containing protein 1 [Pygocentrus nattereri]